MSEQVVAIIFTLIILTFGFISGFFTGIENGKKNSINSTRQSICKQLYQQNTNKYIKCSTKDINENIKLIKDITNDR